MKGLPLTYSKDMQEDKEAVFDAAETLDLMLAAMTGMVGDMTVDAAAMKKAAGSGYSTATDLADWLVRRLGLPFREAHHVTGRAVALAEAKKLDAGRSCRWTDLQAIHAGITDEVFSVLSVQNSVKSRTSLRRHRAGRGAPADPLLAASGWQRLDSQLGRVQWPANFATERSDGLRTGRIGSMSGSTDCS